MSKYEQAVASIDDMSDGDVKQVSVRDLDMTVSTYRSYISKYFAEHDKLDVSTNYDKYSKLLTVRVRSRTGNGGVL